MGEWVYEVMPRHKCSPPLEVGARAPGSVWRCDCGVKWVLRIAHQNGLPLDWRAGVEELRREADDRGDELLVVSGQLPDRVDCWMRPQRFSLASDHTSESPNDGRGDVVGVGNI